MILQVHEDVKNPTTTILRSVLSEIDVWFPAGSVHDYLHPKPEIISNPKTIAATATIGA